MDMINNNKDDLKDVQPYPLELWPETRPAVGRSSSGEQLYPYQVAVASSRHGSNRRYDVEHYSDCARWTNCLKEVHG
jgi:hypothetical protein